MISKSFQKITASILLLVYGNIALPVVPLYAAAVTPVDLPPKITLPEPVRTPANVAINRTAPATAAPATGTLSLTPTDQEVFQARVFPEPFVPVGGSTSTAENAALAASIRQFAASGGGDTAPFEEFLINHPQSVWAASVRLNLGLNQFSTGWFSKAIASYQAAWDAARTATDTRGRALADRAFGELVLMYARVGRKDTLAKMLAEVENRSFLGKASEMVAGARDGLSLMQTHPELAYRCGPGAIDRILADKKGARGIDPVLFKIPSTDKGTSLASVAEWARQAGLDMQLAFREPGAVVLTPAVVHWKLGHFAALFAFSSGGFRIEDPTFAAYMTGTTASIDAEASGYFLVPAGSLPAGWRSVPPDEAATIWGKGSTNDQDVDASTEGDTKIHPDGTCGGMPVANAHAMLVSLNIMDMPLGYTPPVGPAVPFTITYNQREASQATIPDYSNMGSKWVHNWLSFVDEAVYMPPHPPGTVSEYALIPKVRLPGGGSKRYKSEYMFSETYPIVFPKTGNSSDQLKKTNNTTYVLVKSDGSQLVYARRTGTTFSRYHLTAVIDPAGNSVSLGYDTQNRLTSLTDAIGQVTTLAYDYTADPLKITKVTDPFGRYSTIGYDSSGRVASVTDVLGLTSTFTSLGTSELVSSMTTPYGTSSFAFGESGTNGRNRWLEITNPLGEIERVECRNDWSGLPGAGPTPTGMITETGFQNYRNTLYWDWKAYKETYNSAHPDQAAVVGGAHIYHWLHNGDTLTTVSSMLENEKNALETSRVWYNYSGQTNSYTEGTSSQPTAVGRVLDDGTTQLSQFAYNQFDKLVWTIDPLGRATNFVYDTNLIDLLEVRQTTGTSTYDILARATYNSAHQPLTITDAAGQVTTFTYNTRGQPLTVTNAKSEVTTFNYNTNGYLTSVDGPLAGSADSTSFAYDGYGRLRTVTDSEGYAVTTDYDVFDRPTLVTYPDTTTRQIVYERLDAVTTKDRRGRVSRTAYNAIRQAVTSTDPLGRVTQFGWCKCGALRLLIDAAGNSTTWSHDAQGRMTAKNYPDGSSVRYIYENSTSRLKAVIDAKSQSTNYTYFKDNQLQQVSYTNATVATPTVNFTYEANYPRLATMIDGIGTTTYAYNPVPTTPTLGAGRLGTIDGPFANDTIAYTYDELGRVDGRSINATANASTVGYDALGRVTGITNPLGTFTYAYVNATGRPDHVIYPNSQRTNYAYYNNAGDQRLQQIENLKPDASNLSTFTYTYDAEGIIQAWTRKFDAGSVLTSNFKYDLADQLTEAAVPTVASVLTDFVYRYDKAGNRASEQIDNAVAAGTHNNLNQLKTLSATGPIRFAGSLNEAGTVTVNGQAVAVAGDNSFSGDVALPPGSNSVAVVAKDPLNNTTTKNYIVPVASGSARTLTYDLVGNLTDNGAGQTYEWDAGNRLTKIAYIGGARTEFAYDWLGRRVKIIEKNTGGTITSESRFVWDGLQLAEERDGSNAMSKRFYGQGQMDGATKLFYTADHLGSIREMTDDTSAIVARYDYDPYGRMTKLSGSGDADVSYTGHYYHLPSGLYLAPYRAYDAILGRWLSRDPIGENGGINLYSYAGNNPINEVDPLGLWIKPIHEWLIDYAFPMLPASERDILKMASADADRFFPGQETKNSHWHAMSQPGEDVTVAAVKWSKYVEGQRQKAAAECGRSKSLYAFGRGLHGIADSTSPSHEGFQPWEMNHALEHHNREKSISWAKVNETITLMRNYYETTYGKKPW